MGNNNSNVNQKQTSYYSVEYLNGTPTQSSSANNVTKLSDDETESIDGTYTDNDLNNPVSVSSDDYNDVKYESIDLTTPQPTSSQKPSTGKVIKLTSLSSNSTNNIMTSIDNLDENDNISSILGAVRNGGVLVKRSKSYVKPENKVLPREFPTKPLRQTNLFKTDGFKRTWNRNKQLSTVNLTEDKDFLVKPSLIAGIIRREIGKEDDNKKNVKFKSVENLRNIGSENGRVKSVCFVGDPVRSDFKNLDSSTLKKGFTNSIVINKELNKIEIAKQDLVPKKGNNLTNKLTSWSSFANTNKKNTKDTLKSKSFLNKNIDCKMISAPQQPPPPPQSTPPHLNKPCSSSSASSSTNSPSIQSSKIVNRIKSMNNSSTSSSPSLNNQISCTNRNDLSNDIKIISRFPINSKVYRHYIAGNDKLTNSVNVSNLIRNSLKDEEINERGIDVIEDRAIKNDTIYDSIDDYNSKVKDVTKSEIKEDDEDDLKSLDKSSASTSASTSSSISSLSSASSPKSTSLTSPISTTTTSSSSSSSYSIAAPISNKKQNYYNNFTSSAASSSVFSALTSSSIVQNSTISSNFGRQNDNKKQNSLIRNNSNLSVHQYHNNFLIKANTRDEETEDNDYSASYNQINENEVGEESVYETLMNTASGTLEKNLNNTKQETDQSKNIFSLQQNNLKNKANASDDTKRLNEIFQDEIQKAYVERAKRFDQVKKSLQSNSSCCLLDLTNLNTLQKNILSPINGFGQNIAANLSASSTAIGQSKDFKQSQSSAFTKLDRGANNRQKNQSSLDLPSFYLRPPVNYDDNHENYMNNLKNQEADQEKRQINISKIREVKGKFSIIEPVDMKSNKYKFVPTNNKVKLVPPVAPPPPPPPPPPEFNSSAETYEYNYDDFDFPASDDTSNEDKFVASNFILKSKNFDRNESEREANDTKPSTIFVNTQSNSHSSKVSRSLAKGRRKGLEEVFPEIKLQRYSSSFVNVNRDDIDIDRNSKSRSELDRNKIEDLNWCPATDLENDFDESELDDKQFEQPERKIQDQSVTRQQKQATRIIKSTNPNKKILPNANIHQQRLEKKFQDDLMKQQIGNLSMFYY